MKKLVLIAISVLLIGVMAGGSSLVATGANQTVNQTALRAMEASEMIYGSNAAFVTPSEDKLLGQYENSSLSFAKFERHGRVIYWHHRIIDGAIVELDRKLYMFDATTKELIESNTHWRDDLPTELPPIITKEEAEGIAGGGSATLYFIDPESIRFHGMEPTSSPCWVVWNSTEKTVGEYKYNHITITAVNATNGEILGYGTSPLHDGFVCSGPSDQVNCTGGWPLYYADAEVWFEDMGYSIQGIVYPNEAQIKSQIQSNEVAVFYEVAHGAEDRFINDCYDIYSDDWITHAYEIHDWIEYYPQMPFTFLMSCDPMGATGPNTLSYEFRKGLDIGTAVVGGYRMHFTPCRQICSKTFDWYWQDKFLREMSKGKTVQEAFELANDAFSECAECFKFAGDSNLRLVPLLVREESSHGGLIGIVSFPGRGNPPNGRWIESLDVRFFQGDNEMSWSPVSATTSSYGYFNVYGVPTGTYDVAIKNWTCLSELETGVVFYGGEITVVDFGTTREGDANNDDWVTGVDFSLLAGAFGSTPGDANWNANCDFNRDNAVTGMDFSLLNGNFGQGGDLQ